ncbi:MAG: methyltransferase domain-containing protein [Acidobacteria bacterium]|jgi:ubiquinone/menaquinone biosynthesis C-methylase UbiE|nr:methyltransferase domain-containing protein [Acidobacteriota bacterium]
MNDRVRTYWNTHIHDLEISTHAPGTPGFFADLDQYHFEKLHHLLDLIHFEDWKGKDVLDVGCGAGVEVVRFARAGARTTGVDIAQSAIDLARQNLTQQGLEARLEVADGEVLPFPDASFDFVFAHGVVQYTGNDQRMVDEIRRVLRPGGTAFFQAYNRHSWLHVLSKVMKTPLEHEDAPVLRRYSAAEFRALMTGFADVQLIFERFPVKSRLHKGWKGLAFNTFFVGAFNALPRAWVRRYGWHMLAFCRRGDR